jgi:FkbM family methyltransferase
MEPLMASQTVIDKKTIESIVEDLYQSLLSRSPDASGHAFYVAEILASRLSIAEVARGIINSQEFAEISGRRSPPPARVVSDGNVFLLPPGSVLEHELASPQGYEPWVLPYFCDMCRDGMTVLDIGASWGAFTLPASRRVGERGRVFAIEANARNCKILQNNIWENGLTNVEILPFGVSDNLGSAISIGNYAENNTTVRALGSRIDLESPEFSIVPLIPIDVLLPRLGKVDLVKIDIEGMEYRALMGGMAFFRANKPIIFLEYSPAFQQAGSGVEGRYLLTLLHMLGYRFEILHRNRDRELLDRDSMSKTIDLIDAAWQRHVDEDSGTHLDLCAHP